MMNSVSKDKTIIDLWVVSWLPMAAIGQVVERRISNLKVSHSRFDSRSAGNEMLCSSKKHFLLFSIEAD